MRQALNEVIADSRFLDGKFVTPLEVAEHILQQAAATWRPLYLGTRAVKVTGSPFNTFADAEAACDTMLGALEEAVRGAAQVDNAAPY
jgi:hypothetical protein